MGQESQSDLNWEVFPNDSYQESGGSESYNHKEMISANMGLELDSSLVKPSDKITAQPTLWQQPWAEI